MSGRIHQLNLSKGGVPKLPVALAYVTRNGIQGDVQRYTKIHGGPDRAVCLYSLEVIERLRAEGHPIAPGTAGENVTVKGIDWSRIRPGIRLRLGNEVELEVTKYTTPCKTIRESFADGVFTRISEAKHPGDSRVYARVLREGWVTAGAAVELCAPIPG